MTANTTSRGRPWRRCRWRQRAAKKSPGTLPPCTGASGHGITVRSPIDLLVGAWCIRNDCLLIQDDRDFAGMQQIEGLQTT